MGKIENWLKQHLMRKRTHTHTHTKWMQQWPLCILLPLMLSPTLSFLPLSLLSLLSLSPSQVNCSHVIKRPSLYPLTLVNEKKGNKKQFCAANMEKKMITESDVCVFLPLCPSIDTSRAHIENTPQQTGTHGSLCFSPAPTLCYLQTHTAAPGYRPRRC